MITETIVAWTTALGIGGVYTSPSFDVDSDDAIVGSCYANVAGSLAIQQSNDGTNWDIVKTITYTAATTLGFGPVPIKARYGRVVYTNGAVIQATFRLYVLKKKGCSVDQGQLDDIEAYTGRAVSFLDFWSNPQEAVIIPAVAADIALPDVVVSGLPSGCTIVRAVVMFKFRAVENTNAGANKLSGAQDIQVRDDTPSAWIDALNFLDDMFGIADLPPGLVSSLLRVQSRCSSILCWGSVIQ